MMCHTAPPHLTGDYQRVHVATVGTTLRLVCPVIARPTALVEWWKDRHRIHDGWVRHRSVNGTLRVRDVQLSDSGRYTCEATNGFGSAQATLFLHAHGLSYMQCLSKITPLRVSDIFPPNGWEFLARILHVY